MKAYCKKELNTNELIDEQHLLYICISNRYFVKNNVYNYSKELNTAKIIDENNEKCVFIMYLIPYQNRDHYWMFEDYFYTEKEMRNLKLNKLNESTL